jgi:hypothetical protein
MNKMPIKTEGLPVSPTEVEQVERYMKPVKKKKQ